MKIFITFLICILLLNSCNSVNYIIRDHEQNKMNNTMLQDLNNPDMSEHDAMVMAGYLSTAF